MKTLNSLLALCIFYSIPSNADDAAKYHVYFKNDCREKLQTAIRYKKTNDVWASNGFWRLNPGEEKLVAFTNNRVIYVHYSNMDGRHFGGGYKKTVRGHTLDFNKHTFTKPKRAAKGIKLHLDLQCMY